MKLTIDITYEQLLQLVKQLPKDKIAEIIAELDRMIIEKKLTKKASDYRGILKGIDTKGYEGYIRKNRGE